MLTVDPNRSPILFCWKDIDVVDVIELFMYLAAIIVGVIVTVGMFHLMVSIRKRLGLMSQKRAD